MRPKRNDAFLLDKVRAFIVLKHTRAEVVKLVDAVDSKSTGPCAHAGSIPAFGTTLNKEHIGEIAKLQYSMIVDGMSSLPVFYKVLADWRKSPDLNGDVFDALRTSLKINLEPVEV